MEKRRLITYFVHLFKSQIKLPPTGPLLFLFGGQRHIHPQKLGSQQPTRNFALGHVLWDSNLFPLDPSIGCPIWPVLDWHSMII